MADNPPPFCPHLTGVQILSFGLSGMLVPIGEADVSDAQDMADLGNKLKRRPASMGGTGGLDLSQIGKKLPVYSADLTAKFKRPTAELEQEKKDQKPLENPTITPETTLVPCQGPACFYWCPDHQTCGAICHECKAKAMARVMAVAFESALRSHAKNTQFDNTQGAQDSPEKEESLDHPSPAL